MGLGRFDGDFLFGVIMVSSEKETFSLEADIMSVPNTSDVNAVYSSDF